MSKGNKGKATANNPTPGDVRMPSGTAVADLPTTASEHEPRADQMTIPGIEVTASAEVVQNDDGTFTLGNDPVTVENGPIPDLAPLAEAPVAPAAGKAGKKGGKTTKSKSAADLADKALAAAKAAREKIEAERHHNALSLGWKPAETLMLPLGDDKKLCFPKQLQMRSLGKSVVNPAVVADYRDHMKDHIAAAKEEGRTPEPGLGFPPLRAIRITDDDRDINKLPGNVVVFSGFHRGGAAFEAGVKSFPVEVMDGTFKFARLLALGENRSHGLQRTNDDKIKAFNAIIDDPEMMADALELARTGGSGREGGKGGLNRALSYVSGLSKGSVSNYLAARGLSTSGDKLVKRRERPASEADDTTTEAATDAGDTDTPASTRTRHESGGNLTDEQIKAQASIDVIEAMERLHASFERQLGEILTRDDSRDLFIASAKQYGIPITVTELQENGQPVYQTAWPTMDSLTLVLESVKTELTQAKLRAASPESTQA